MISACNIIRVCFELSLFENYTLLRSSDILEMFIFQLEYILV